MTCHSGASHVVVKGRDPNPDSPGGRDGTQMVDVGRSEYGVFMLLLDLTIVNVALPDIQRAFGATLSDLQWDDRRLRADAGGVPVDRGRARRPSAGGGCSPPGSAVFTAGSLLWGLATARPLVALARAPGGRRGDHVRDLAGADRAGLPGPRPRRRLRLLGAITGVAVAVGPVVGGLLTSGLSWRWIFFVNLPIGIVALLRDAADEVRRVAQPVREAPRLVGFATFSGGLAALTFGLIRSAARPAGARPRSSASLAAAAVPAHGLRLSPSASSSNAMFDLALLRKPSFDGGLIAALGVQRLAVLRCSPT